MKAVGIFMAFIAILVLSMFAIGFVDSVQAPTNATALAQYNNMTQIIDISSSGIQGTLLILLGAMIFAACIFMISMLKRR